jgi:hypothetical protein
MRARLTALLLAQQAGSALQHLQEPYGPSVDWRFINS